MDTAPVPDMILRAVTDAYVAALKQGDPRSALSHMIRLNDAYGLPAVRSLAVELIAALHVRCPARFRTALGAADISALAPAHRGDPLTLRDVASKANRMMGRREVTDADLEETGAQMRVTEVVRSNVQAALNSAPLDRDSTAVHLASLSTAQEISAAVALLTNGLLVVLP